MLVPGILHCSNLGLQKPHCRVNERSIATATAGRAGTGLMTMYTPELMINQGSERPGRVYW